MSKDATIPEAFQDLVEGQIATIATVGADGRPQVSAVWFLYEDGELKVSLHVGRQKTKNLERNPAVTLFLLDLQNPTRYLEVRGDARLEPDTDYRLADAVGAKYGADLRNMDGGDHRRVALTVEPARVVAVDLTAG